MNDLLLALLDLPPEASTFAFGVDMLHYLVIGTTMLGATFVFLLALLFLVRSRRRAPGELTARAQGSASTELTLIGVLLTVFIVFWIVGATQYDRMMTPPPDAPARLRHGQTVDVEVLVRGRALVDGRPHGPGGSSDQARDDLARRHP